MRILLSAPYSNEYELGRYCARGLGEIGHSVKIFDYQKISYILGSHITPWSSLIHKIGAKKANDQLLKVIDQWNPEMLLVIRGEIIYPETIRWIKNKKGITAVNWFPDFPTDIQKSLVKFDEMISEYDHFFIAYKKGIQELRENYPHINILFLPFACDPMIHKKIEISEEEFKNIGADISFVGAMYNKRVEILQSLTGYNLKIWGPRWKKSGNKKIIKKYMGDAAYSEKMVKIFNATKINLNIHKSEVGKISETSGVNMRLFEIAGSGGFQITDYRSELPELFEISREIVYYKDLKDLKEKVDYFLQNPEERRKIAVSCQKRAYRDHTYEKRMIEMLSSCK